MESARTALEALLGELAQGHVVAAVLPLGAVSLDWLVVAPAFVQLRALFPGRVGGSDEVGRHIAKAVRRITEKPVTHVVNTHHHGDHVGGVAELK